MVSAQSRERRVSKVSFRGSETKTAQQLSPAAPMGRSQASYSRRGATPGEHAREETLALSATFTARAPLMEESFKRPHLAYF